MKIMVMGYGQHGKGTFCSIATQLGLTSMSSSLFACEEFLFEALKPRFGYPDIATCYKDRHNHRALWYREILAFNTPDLTRLGRGIFSRYDIYDGIRQIDEFNALKQAGLFDLAVWIDASERMPNESSDSISVHRGCADVILENNGSELEFAIKVRALLTALYKTK